MSTALLDTRFRVTGMDCAACAAKVEAASRRVPGVDAVAVSVTTGTMLVRHAAGTDLDEIARRVGDVGYGATLAAPHPPAGDDHAHAHSHAAAIGDGPWWQSRQVLLTLACAAAIGLAFALTLPFPQQAGWLFAAAMLVGLLPIARRAVTAARNGMPFTIETLMSVAAIGAVIIGASEEAAIVVLLFLVGELLEGLAAGRARAGITALARLVPRTALVERDGVTAEVPAEAVAVGSLILVRPGDRVAADGVIVSGESAIDEAPVTGESVPKRKIAGDSVYAGTINQDGTLRLRVTAAAADNTIARIVRLVEEAQEAKAPTARLIERFSRYYTPGVMLVAALVAVLPPLVTGADWSGWIYKGLAVLLIGCPCALVISTPAAIAAALSAGARRGLLMKGGAVLETLGHVDQVALDKTGTLTEGRPQVTDILAVGRGEDEVLRLAAALEAGSSHPLARAILAAAAARGLAVQAAEGGGALSGKGVTGRLGAAALFLGSAQAAAERVKLPDEFRQRIDALNAAGKTVSVLLVNEAVAGAIAMRDEPRADARAGIAALEAIGVVPLMLTGDNARTAEAVAAELGIEARAGLLPEDKQRIVGELQARGRIVAKVGDGINDAPALAAADIGIAMGGGTDVALETADAAVLHGRVTDIAEMIVLSRTTARNIRQNIAIALGLKAVFLVTTVLGVTGLWPAILADTGATVLVTANALRLLAWRGMGR
jgi:Cd2+/Zn2+-exporting ATPase